MNVCWHVYIIQNPDMSWCLPWFFLLPAEDTLRGAFTVNQFSPSSSSWLTILIDNSFNYTQFPSYALSMSVILCFPFTVPANNIYGRHACYGDRFGLRDYVDRWAPAAASGSWKAHNRLVIAGWSKIKWMSISRTLQYLFVCCNFILALPMDAFIPTGSGQRANLMVA